MTDKTEIVTDTMFNVLRCFKAYKSGGPVSWKRFGDGVRNLEVQTHPENRYLAFTMQECDLETKNRAMRQTMLTLSAGDAQKLFDWMVESGFEASQ